MDNLQIMLVINGVLFATLGFFIRGYLKRQSDDHKELKEQVEKIIEILGTKADATDCKETHSAVEKYLHKHASQGTAGEVVVL
jgi:hypothetical protein